MAALAASPQRPADCLMFGEVMKMLKRSTLAALVLVIGQSAAMAQGSFLEHLLLSPTRTPGDVPETYGTAYDCRPLKAANQTAGVWSSRTPTTRTRPAGWRRARPDRWSGLAGYRPDAPGQPRRLFQNRTGMPSLPQRDERLYRLRLFAGMQAALKTPGRRKKAGAWGCSGFLSAGSMQEVSLPCRS